MREIKFRAWDKDKKTMLEVLNGVVGEWTVGTRAYADTTEWPEIYELMQFTGLKDKNGIEIYEGDIVRYYADGLPEDEQKAVLTNGSFASYPVRVEVLPWESEFSDSEHDDFHEMIDRVVYSGCSFYVTPVNVEGELGSLWRASEHCEVIGNIYENPELLEKK